MFWIGYANYNVQRKIKDEAKKAPLIQSHNLMKFFGINPIVISFLGIV